MSFLDYLFLASKSIAFASWLPALGLRFWFLPWNCWLSGMLIRIDGSDEKRLLFG